MIIIITIIIDALVVAWLCYGASYKLSLLLIITIITMVKMILMIVVNLLY